LNSNICYAIGDNSTILRSTNAGATWSQLPFIENVSLYGIHIMNKNQIFVCGRSIRDHIGVIYKTEDGGLTWTISSKSSSVHNFSTIYFVDDKTGFAGGEQGVIVKTTDGGKTWKETYTVTESKINKILFNGLLKGYAVCDDGKILKSNDEGEMWMSMKTNVNSNLHTIAISPDKKHLIAAGDNETFLIYTF